jgi:thiol:disulfide interchange protein DsbA
VAALEKELAKEKDVAFRREHVVWPGRSDIEAHARLFVTLRTMGLLDRHHQAVFDAIHKEKTSLRTEKEIFDWVAKRGIDRAKFEATYKSFGVNTQIARARDLIDRFEADGVPSFGINGKYYTSLAAARGSKRMLEIVHKLIADERAARK